MPAIKIADLNNAKQDVDHMAEIATSAALTATDRLGHTKRTLAGLASEFPNAQANADAAAGSADAAAGSAEVAAFAKDLAQAAKEQAELARDAALVSGEPYVDEPTGRAAVADGQAFKVQGSGDVAAYAYRRIDADNSEPLPSYPSANAKIAPDRTVFLIPGKNLFDKAAATLGKYLTDTGVLADNPAYGVSDYIAVEPGASYYANASGMRYTCYFDRNKIVQVGGSDVGTSPFTVPPGISYVRVTLFASDIDIFQLENGSTTAYEPFHYRLALSNRVPIVPQEDSLPLGWLSGDKLKDHAIDRIHLLSGAVTPAKTNFLPLGKNKFNKNSVTVGEYLTPNGVAAPNAEYDYSDFIPTRPGPYALNSAAMRMSCFFDEKKEVIPGGYDGGTSIDHITIPDGVAYVRITVEHYAVAALQMEEGSVSTPYEECHYELRSEEGIPIRVDVGAAPTVEGPALAATQYIPNGKEIALYLENVVRDYQSVKGHVGISFLNGRETGEATKLIPTVDQVGAVFNGNAVVIGKDFDFIVGASGKSIQVRISDASKATPINVQNIGDSFTGRMTWANVINETPAAAGITYSGNRTANSTNQTVKCEGQGGWTMQSYFTVDFSGCLSPFMQPVNAYKHFGPTSFWIDANSPEPSYNATYFDGVREQFDAVTGRKKAPAVNDVMSDGGGYIVWNGAAWVGISLATLGGFAFNYGKYRAAWGIPQPSILHVLLGTNDFYSADANSFPGTYATYKTRYEQLIASVQADSPACKIIVGIPVSSGRQGEYGTLTTERVKRAMWLLAKNLIADFDEREAEGIYVLDYHSAVHRVYGFDFSPEKPTADYTGPDTYKYITDITHCSLDGFKQMGNAYMGLIQHLR